jgi:hypothetical protein
MNRRVLTSLALLVAVFVGGNCIAQTGYREQYDYVDQGADWYADALAPNPRYDFGVPEIETFSDGSDFDLGYAIAVDSFGFGPPLDLTNSSRHEYYFVYGALPVSPYVGDGGGGGPNCDEDADCTDGVFCNGEEVCLQGYCRLGLAPDCTDGDTCTLDYCNTSTDSCRNVPFSDPGEVQFLTLRIADPATTVAVLDWYSRPLSDYYSVYRAEFTDLSDLACHAGEVFATTLADDGAIGSNGLFLYLVTAVGCGGESTLGDGSGGDERIGSPCPPP